MAVYLSIGLLQTHLGFFGVFRCFRFSVQIRPDNIPHIIFHYRKLSYPSSGCARNTVPYL